MTWRELIDQYLSACAADDRARLTADLRGERRLFIESHGTRRFKQYENGRLESHAERLEEPSLSSDSYEIVQEKADLIIAEVQPAKNGHPYMLTRFRLVRNQEQWELDDYLWKCQCSNGECDWCDGSGVCAICHGEGECKFCRGEHMCQLCKGTRTCRRCKDSYMPGWNSMASSR